MSLGTIVILILVLALILYLISILPIEPKFKQIAQGLIILAAIIWLIQAFLPGVWLGTHRIN
jgi:hypothetical protein